MSDLYINKIFIHYGEIGLKGKNQPYFRKKLKKNIRIKLHNLGLDWPVEQVRGYVTICVPPQDKHHVDSVLQSLKQVPGIVYFEPAIGIPITTQDGRHGTVDLSSLETSITQMAEEKYQPGKTFCVRVKRGNKQFPIHSVELARLLGAVIINYTKWDMVNLSQPDQLFSVNIQKDELFLSCDKYFGCGGLPVGTVGQVLVLLSGGIDSPVAAYQMARRGCQIDFIHFTATRMQHQEAEEYKITKLVRHVNQYCLRSRLYLVPYIHFDMALYGADVKYDLILFRRFMVRVAEKLAGQLHADVLVSGDNLAQVASQTMTNMVSIDKAVDIPIFRPLLTYDKQEITKKAQDIGTYNLSIEPYKDCCALISRHPKTASNHQNLLKIEEEVFAGTYSDLIDRTLEDTVMLEFGS